MWLNHNHFQCQIWIHLIILVWLFSKYTNCYFVDHSVIFPLTGTSLQPSRLPTGFLWGPTGDSDKWGTSRYRQMHKYKHKYKYKHKHKYKHMHKHKKTWNINTDTIRNTNTTTNTNSNTATQTRLAPPPPPPSWEQPAGLFCSLPSVLASYIFVTSTRWLGGQTDGDS